MKYTNTHAYTHIRALAALLAFASVILAPASASAQNAASQQPAATAAGSSKSSDNTKQTTEQSDAQPSLPLDQKISQYVTWALRYFNPKADELDRYRLSCAAWLKRYNDIAVPAIKKYGTDQEKEAMAAISKDAKKVEHEIDASGVRIIKFNKGPREARLKMQQNPSEKNYMATIQKNGEMVALFNTESEFAFEKGKILLQYHQTITAALDRIVAELKKDPKTQSAAGKIEKGWSKKPRFMSYTQPIKAKPFVLKPE